MSVVRLGILVSGRGSNMRALLSAIGADRVGAIAAVVVSNRVTAPALEYAAELGVPTAVVEHRRFNGDRAAFERALDETLSAHRVELVVLAGFMRVLSSFFVQRWSGRIVNIHPSLLPSFPGLHAHRQALQAGVKVSGCTVHFVDEGTDTGPIIAQATVPVLEGDTEDSLAARVLVEEHRLLPEAIALIAAGRVSIQEGRARISDGGRSV